MRVTNSTIANQTLHNITSSLRRLDRYNHQLSTGKRISIPSDDPAGTEIAMRLETTILETEQYVNNVDDGISWLNASDDALNHVTQTMQRARELAIYGASDSLSDESRQALAEEADQLLDDLIQVGNLRHGQKYLFGGENTLTEPFTPIYGGDDGETVVSVQYNGTSGDFSQQTDADVKATLGLEQEIGPGIDMRISVHGDVAILPAIESLIHLRDNLREGNTQALTIEDTSDSGDTRPSAERVDDALDTIVRWRAEAGARGNRLELVRNRLEQTHTNLNRLLSERVDVDVAEVVMNLKMEENVYRMALASGARIIQPTLLDFLR